MKDEIKLAIEGKDRDYFLSKGMAIQTSQNQKRKIELILQR